MTPPIVTKTRLQAGGYWHDDIIQVDWCGKYWFAFGFIMSLKDDIKLMEGAGFYGYEGKWAPKEVALAAGRTKFWAINKSPRNEFQLKRMRGEKPYARYNAPLVELEFSPRQTITGEWITPYNHQQRLTRFFLTRKQCIGAAEMGTGKTLSAILAMEMAGLKDDEVWYVAPRSALKAVERELRFWKSKVRPRLLTYDALVKEHKLWEINGRPVAPKMVIFDESSRAKNPTAQRSQACLNLANYVREDHGEFGYVILMSGSPAPKAPTDWWHQCEVACPGFLKEGSWEKSRNRLGLIVERENTITGGIFPQLITWKDSAEKCDTCGKNRDAHEALGATDIEAVSNSHIFKPCKNEVTLLYERMKGLVEVMFKRDCLDLPEKRYEIARLKPKGEMLRAAKIIAATETSVAQRLGALRELADGFQYTEKQDGWNTCERCHGTKRTHEYFDPTDPQGEAITASGDVTIEANYERREIDCPCGTGQVPRIVRGIEYVPTPKEDELRSDLDEHEDVGRLIIYGGFQGSVDRIVEICKSEKWATIRWDGRGIQIMDPEGKIITGDPLTIFQDELEKYPRVAFVGQPGASGMGITLTRSPTIIYFSNDFNAESRIQSEDRHHRPGMDKERGGRIKDYFLLPSCELVYNNLKAKRTLQEMTLTGIDWNAWKSDDERIF